jgi:hypothetical protein
MGVATMLDTLPSSEITEWLAFSQLEPFGGIVEDMRAGIAAATTVNVNQGEGARTFGPLDFFPWHREQKAAVPLVRQEGESEQAFLQRQIFASGS